MRRAVVLFSNASIVIPKNLKRSLTSLASATQNGRNSVKHNFKVYAERHVLYVQQIIGQALYHLVYIGGVAIFYHTPRCDAGAYLVYKTV